MTLLFSLATLHLRFLHESFESNLGHRFLPTNRRQGPSKMAMALLGFLAGLRNLVAADCQCGYSTPVGDDATQQVFTDLIETDFSKIPDVSENTDWARQAFNVTAQRARGGAGEMFAVENVGTASSDGTALELTVRSSQVDGMVSGAEIDTARLDVFYGSFRSSLRLTNVSGTVAAFFWVSVPLADPGKGRERGEDAQG